MTRLHHPPSWDSSSNQSYIPISHEGNVVGFCQPDYANRIVETLNEEDRLRKALHLACQDLISRGVMASSVEALVHDYLHKSGRPRKGTALIALMLKERQAELDITDAEFAKFCDSYKLSRHELQAIYNGTEIESSQLLPLSRILGMTVDEVIEAWKGREL